MGTVKTLRAKHLVALLILFALLSSSTLIVSAEEADHTYAYTLIRFEVVGIGSSTVHARLRLKVPTYLLVDRENTIQAIFERETGCWSGTIVTFYITIRYTTLDRTASSTLAAVSFSAECGVSSVQEKEISVIIPRELYRQLASNVVEIIVSDYHVHSPVSVREKTILENIGAKSYVVEYAPKVLVEIRDISVGHIPLKLDETREIGINVTSLYGPVEIRWIEFQQPSFLSVYVNTPLPLTIGINESRVVRIGVKGISPGAGVLRIDLAYYDGVEVRKASAFIPIIVEEDKIYSLIQEYEAKIRELEQEVRELEARLGVSTLSAMDISSKLSQLILELEVLINQYQKALADMNVLKSDQELLSRNIASLEHTVNSTMHMLSILSSEVSSVDSRLNILENAANQLMSQVDQLEESLTRNASSINQRISLYERESAKLQYGLIALGGLLAALYAIVVMYLVKTPKL